MTDGAGKFITGTCTLIYVNVVAYRQVTRCIGSAVRVAVIAACCICSSPGARLCAEVTIHVGTGLVAVQGAVGVGGARRIRDTPDTVEAANIGRNDIIVMTALAGFCIAVVMTVLAHVLLRSVSRGADRVTQLVRQRSYVAVVHTGTVWVIRRLQRS